MFFHCNCSIPVQCHSESYKKDVAYTIGSGSRATLKFISLSNKITNLAPLHTTLNHMM